MNKHRKQIKQYDIEMVENLDYKGIELHVSKKKYQD